jgi:hypothetical protein
VVWSYLGQHQHFAIGGICPVDWCLHQSRMVLT